MLTRPTNPILLSGFAALAIVGTSMLTSTFESNAATPTSASTAVLASATSGTSSTTQSPARTFAATATTATTSASFRTVGADVADASAAGR